MQDWPAFASRVEAICRFIIAAVGKRSANTISVEEKKGIQGLESAVGRAPNSQGWQKRMECEYKKNGTTTLMAAVNVENGRILYQHLVVCQH